jgi:hypothetical protein
LNNTFAYNTFYYIEKSSILLKVIMGYILGLSVSDDTLKLDNTLKLITECDARIEYQDGLKELTTQKQLKFQKISNTLWKCEDHKWPLQYLGAIDFHKLESIYDNQQDQYSDGDGENLVDLNFINLCNE